MHHIREKGKSACGCWVLTARRAVRADPEPKNPELPRHGNFLADFSTAWKKLSTAWKTFSTPWKFRIFRDVGVSP
jgi:hypothetical protein